MHEKEEGKVQVASSILCKVEVDFTHPAQSHATFPMLLQENPTPKLSCVERGYYIAGCVRKKWEFRQVMGHLRKKAEDCGFLLR